jgi:hypothetical protein
MIARSSAPVPPRKAKWTAREDNQLRAAVRIWGTDSWSRIATYIPGRTGKQCRERWLAQIAPAVSKEEWLPDEDEILLANQAMNGNKWTEIAAKLPGRSPLKVKNRWHWLRRHQRMAERERLATTELPKVQEVPAPSHAFFEPLWIENSDFSRRFEEFRAQMLTKKDDKP